MHLVITDSGLGGLAICGGIERALRLAGTLGDVRLTYFNAWPEERLGYNSLPDEQTRLAYFDRALVRMSRWQPDRVVIACNTLSVMFGRTRFARTSALPVTGIIDAGVELFRQALGANPTSAIALFGTRITMESGVHRDRLIQRGISPGRIVSVPCHGLAAAIEKDAESPEVERLIGECAAQVSPALTDADPLFAGLCCTHYGYVADPFRRALERVTGRTVHLLDPGGALVAQIAPGQMPGFTGEPPGLAGAETRSTGEAAGAITIEVVSKVGFDERTRAGIGRLVAPISPATARALHAYSHDPGLF